MAGRPIVKLIPTHVMKNEVLILDSVEGVHGIVCRGEDRHVVVQVGLVETLSVLHQVGELDKSLDRGLALSNSPTSEY